MSSRLGKLLRARHAEDVLPGDFVRRIGFTGAGIVETVNGENATVAWDKDKRDILPFRSLRRVRQGGASFDHRIVR